MGSTMFPIWAIVLIVLVIILTIIGAIFFAKKRLGLSQSSSRYFNSVQGIQKQVTIEEEEEKVKKSMSVGSLQTLVTQQYHQKKKSFASESCPLTPATIITTPSLPIQQITRKQEEMSATPRLNDKPASSFDESDYYYLPPEPPQEIKISLPLPPPSTSFFSDKMELGDGGNDLFDIYLSTKKNEDSSTDNAGGNSSFASNLQQKAANIKSSLYQSLRLQQKSNNNKTSAQQLFNTNNDTVIHMDATPKKSSETIAVSSNDPLYKPHADAINNKNKQSQISNKSDMSTASTKTVVDQNANIGENAFMFDEQRKKSLEMHRQAQPIPKRIDTINTEIYYQDESPITPNMNLQEPVRAAKRVIRSASRKSKARSMIVQEEEEVFPTISTENKETIQQEGSGKKQTKHGSVRYASVRGSKTNGNQEHMTLTTGSMRKMIRQSGFFDEDSIPSVPLGVASVSNSGSRKNKGISAVDIAGWWDGNLGESASNKTNVVYEKSSSTDAQAGSNSGKINPQSQYRTSLATSIFGTLSKASGPPALALLGEPTSDDELPPTKSGTVSRHGSFKKGTLGRSTLRSITATAASGLNRSLKDLFDNHGTSSSSGVPDGSQKMELGYEAAVLTSDDGKPRKTSLELPVTPSKAQQKKQTEKGYSSVRQKSLRSSDKASRPALPSTYLPNSESSTKYALSDEDEVPDKSSKKTAVDIDEVMTKGLFIEKKITEPESVRTTSSNKAEVTLEGGGRSFASDIATPASGEVDNIRRMLQDTWMNNMKESGSVFSILSDSDSVSSTSSAVVTNKPIPRPLQSQHLSKSLLTQQVAKRASLLARHDSEFDFIFQQGPEPSASFSSSTVQTIVPANESTTEPISIRQNLIKTTTANESNKVLASSIDDSRYSSALANRFSSSVADSSTVASQKTSTDNSIASSRDHSRKSSSGNSTATALRVSNGYASAHNSKTWNGGRGKNATRPSVVPFINTAQLEGLPISPPSVVTAIEDESFYSSVASRASDDETNINKRAFFSTMRKGQKSRGGIPWATTFQQQDNDRSATVASKTPAQIERDKYLEGRY